MKLVSLSVENLTPRALAEILTAVQDTQHWTQGDRRVDRTLSMKIMSDKTLGVYR